MIINVYFNSYVIVRSCIRMACAAAAASAIEMQPVAHSIYSIERKLIMNFPMRNVRAASGIANADSCFACMFVQMLAEMCVVFVLWVFLCLAQIDMLEPDVSKHLT